MVLTLGGSRWLRVLAVAVALPCDAQRGFGPGRGQSAGPRPMLFGFALECSGCTRDRPEGESMSRSGVTRTTRVWSRLRKVVRRSARGFARVTC